MRQKSRHVMSLVVLCALLCGCVTASDGDLRRMQENQRQAVMRAA
jgi:hypothetical protein